MSALTMCSVQCELCGVVFVFAVRWWGVTVCRGAVAGEALRMDAKKLSGLGVYSLSMVGVAWHSYSSSAYL